MPRAFENWRIVRVLGKQYYLLLSLVVLLFAFPLSNETEFRGVALNLALALIIITGPLSLAAQRLQFLIAVVLAALTWLPRWVALIAPQSAVAELIGSAAAALFFGHLGILVFKSHLLDVRTVTTETVVAAVNAYLCIGLMFAFIYVNLYVVAPDGFHGALLEQVSAPRQVDDFVYYSFVTMTTLGYGDITPVSLLAGTFAYVQALLGQLYVATTIARVVGIQVSQR